MILFRGEKCTLDFQCFNVLRLSKYNSLGLVVMLYHQFTLLLYLTGVSKCCFMLRFESLCQTIKVIIIIIIIISLLLFLSRRGFPPDSVKFLELKHMCRRFRRAHLFWYCALFWTQLSVVVSLAFRAAAVRSPFSTLSALSSGPGMKVLLQITHKMGDPNDNSLVRTRFSILSALSSGQGMRKALTQKWDVSSFGM